MRIAIAVVLMLGAASTASAQTPGCDALPAEARGIAQRLLERLHPYDCCDDTVATCLAAKDRCSLAVRLAEDVCRQVKAGKTADEIERALSKRAQSMLDTGARASFGLDEAMAVGDAASPVKVVVYACARCPFCSVVLPALYKEVAEGSLKGKVQLYFRPFPLKSHPGSTEAALAFVASARKDKFWPYLLHSYGHFKEFDEQKLPGWAADIGLDAQEFKTLVGTPQVRDVLVESKKEGLRNKVSSTPAIFINGRQYVYEMDTAVLVDVLQEEYERVRAP